MNSMLLQQQMSGPRRGDHRGPIYETRGEQIAAAVPFLIAGIQRGERCVYIGDAASGERIVRALQAAGENIRQDSAGGAFQLITYQESVLSADQISPMKIIDFLHGLELRALNEGYSGIRVLVDMTWALNPDVDIDRMMELEALHNKFLTGSRMILSCQYNTEQFRSSVMHDVLRMHPAVVLGDQVCPNPHYEPPELVLSSELLTPADLKSMRADWWIAQLERTREAEQERERLLKQLQFERGRFEAVLKQLPAGVIVVEAPSGKLLLANDQVEVLFRHPVGPLAGLEDYHRFKGIHPDGRAYEPEEWPLARSILTGEEVVQEVIEIVRGDGTRATIQASSAPVRDGGGRITAGVVTFWDISDLKRAEERQRESTASLHALSRRLVEVQEDERRRLARELHDEIGQLLTSLSLIVEGTLHRSASADAAGILEARALIADGLTRVRDMSFDLRPALLDHLGLLPALRGLIERYSASTGVRVDFQQAGLDRRFSPQLETAAYRIVQEALTNVARHSGIEDAAVRVWQDGDSLKVQVEDEGVGFNAETVLAGGGSNGLPGMRERVLLLSGRLIIESTPGSGVHLLAELPR